MVNVDQVLGDFRERFGIEYLGSPDSDVVGADKTRIHEFCDVYEQADLDDAHKTALMALIVASLDTFLSDGLSDPVLEERIAELVKRDFELHKDTIHYWCKQRKLAEGEVLWSVTPFARAIWEHKTREQL